jgi:hypothetical protein
MDRLMILCNAIVMGLLAAKLLRDGLRGTRKGWNPLSMGISMQVNLPVPMTQRERYWVAGTGALCAMASAFDLTAFLIMTLRHR